MSKVKIRHYTIKRGKAFWQPTAKMRLAGFQSTPLGESGPDAWRIAEGLNAKWDSVRRSIEQVEPDAIALSSKPYPARSVGDSFHRFRMTPEWAAKAPATRVEYDRAWKYIEPVFARHKHHSVTMEVISTWRLSVEKSKGVREAHRCMKIWRALWNVSAAFGYCARGADPSLAVKNREAEGRKETYSYFEVKRLVKTALRNGQLGYACIVSLMWDGALSPIDGRSITAGQMRKDAKGRWFEYRRGKTGRQGVIAVSRQTERLLSWYLAKFYHGLDIAPGTVLFRTEKGMAFTKNRLTEIHAEMRVAAMLGDTRKLLDIRRSASTEALAGGVHGLGLSTMMANSLSQSNSLERTYLPIQIGKVRDIADARQEGRRNK